MRSVDRWRRAARARRCAAVPEVLAERSAMSSAALVAAARRSHSDCRPVLADQPDGPSIKWACGARCYPGPAHLDFHLALAVAADRERVATEAWMCGYTHDADDEHDCDHKFKEQCRDAVVLRLMEQGA